MNEHIDETCKVENTKRRRIEELVRAWRDEARLLRPKSNLADQVKATMLEKCAEQLERRLLEQP